MRLFLASSLAALAGCAVGPDAALSSITAHNASLGPSTGPAPQYVYYLVGSADAALVRGVPVEFQGAVGSARFLSQGIETKVVDGVYHFIAILAEKDFWTCCGYVGFDPDVTISFVDAEGHRTLAAGRVSVGKALYGNGVADFHPAWKER